MKKMNIKGFTSLESALIVIVVVLIAAVGWSVSNNQSKKDSNKTEPQTKKTEMAKDPIADQIVNLDKAPVASRPLIILAAKDNLAKCDQFMGPKAEPETKVEISQSNFVSLSVTGCETGNHQYLALENNAWKSIGSGQMTLDCETIDKYKIVSGSYIDGLNEANKTCTYQDGRSKPIPN